MPAMSCRLVREHGSLLLQGATHSATYSSRG